MEETIIKLKKQRNILFAITVTVVALLFFTYINSIKGLLSKNAQDNIAKQSPQDKKQNQDRQNISVLANEVLPTEGVELPVVWKGMGKSLVLAGVIDDAKFQEVYAGRGELSADEQKLLFADDNGHITINTKNASLLLNLLWAFGLSNKNDVLEKGDMMDPQYGGAGRFASTAGWTLSQGETMDHYSKHRFMTLTAEQQSAVEEVAKNIYRPCCGNSTYFPDCNHGMAMLGLLELMASQNVSKKNMYQYALAVNSYWFPDIYLNIANYFKNIERVNWDKVDPKKALSYDYSSNRGYQQILSKIEPQKSQSNGGGCSV